MKKCDDTMQCNDAKCRKAFLPAYFLQGGWRLIIDEFSLFCFFSRIMDKTAHKFKGGIDDMKKLLRCTELVLRDFEFG